MGPPGGKLQFPGTLRLVSPEIASLSYATDHCCSSVGATQASVSWNTERGMRRTYVSRVYVTIVVGIRHDLRCLAKDRQVVRVEADALVTELFVRYVALDLSASSTSTGAWGVLPSSETLGFAGDGCGKGTVL